MIIEGLFLCSIVCYETVARQSSFRVTWVIPLDWCTRGSVSLSVVLDVLCPFGWYAMLALPNNALAAVFIACEGRNPSCLVVVICHNLAVRVRLSVF